MKTYKDFIIYKGQDKEVQIPFAVSGFTDFTASFYTDKEYEILKTAEDFDFDGEWASIFFDNTALDLLNDGVLRYTFNYKIDGVDVVKSTNSAYTLRTPENYSAHTADEVYQEGVDDQKAKLSSITIVENGTYQAEDGYSAVTVSVSGGSSVDIVSTAMTITQDVETIESEAGTAWSAVSVNAINYGNGRYEAGYSRGSSDGYASGYTDGMVSGTSVGYDEGVAEQKAKLTGVTITENGQYNRPDGYSAVTVNIPPTKGLFLFDKEYELPIVATLRSSDTKADKRKVEFGVAFGNLSNTEYKFARVAGIDFWVNSEAIWAEYEDSHEVEYDETIHSRITTGVTYGITLEVGSHSLEINGEPFGPDNDNYNETYVGGTYFGNSALTMNVSYFEYFTSSGVSQINVTNYAESGLTFAIVKTNPVLQNKEVTIWANGDTVITPDGAGGELVDGYYAMSSVTVHAQVYKWSKYYDYMYYLVREDCSNDGTYLCHCNGGNTYAGVNIQNGHIINTGFMPNPTQLGEDHYICIKDYSNPDTGQTEHYSFECWIEYGKLYWKCSARVWLDAYDTGTNKQGLYLDTL